MNLKILRGIMAISGDGYKELGSALGLGTAAVSKKFTGHSRFNHVDIQKIVKRYALTPEETYAIFFDSDVVESDDCVIVSAELPEGGEKQ